MSLDLVQRAVEHHPDVLINLFRDLLRLADVMVRSNEARVRAVGAGLQSSAFKAFPDQHDRNLVVDAFVTQISDAAAPDTANAALAELYKLVRADPRAVDPYKNHLDALQEYLLHFDDAQLRCVMAIFAMLAVETVRRDTTHGTHAESLTDRIAEADRHSSHPLPFHCLCALS